MPKISAYTSGNPPQATDAFIIARAGQNYRITGGMLFPREGEMINGKLSPTVAAGSLQVAIKTLSGADPSAANPVLIMIGGVLHAVTAALSTGLTSGSNRMNAGSAELATREIDIFAYMGWNAVDGVTLALARFPYARVYGDFNRITATDEHYAPVSVAINAVATDQYVVVGRLAATCSAGAAYTWTIPTYTPTNLIQYPIYETRRLSWLPTYTGFTGAVTTGTAAYQWVGRRMFYEVDFSGTSNAAGLTFTLPWTPLVVFAAIVRGLDNGGGVAALLNNSVATMFAYKDAAATAWTAGGTKGIFDAHFEVVGG